VSESVTLLQAAACIFGFVAFMTGWPLLGNLGGAVQIGNNRVLGWTCLVSSILLVTSFVALAVTS
jgi:hypothetical protein